MAYFYVILSTLLMTFVRTIVKYLPDLSPEQIVFIRMGITLFFCLSFLKNFTKHKKAILQFKTILFLRGLFGTLGMVLLFLLIQRTRFDSATALFYLHPLFTLICCYVFLGERFPPNAFFGIFFALVGILILKNFDPSLDFISLLLGLGAALFASLAYTCIRKIKQEIPSSIIVTIFPLLAVPLLLPFAIQQWKWPSTNQWILLVLLGASSWIGQLCLTKALQLKEAHKITPLNYLGAFYSLLIGNFLFQETVSLQQFIGISLIFTGLIINYITKK